MELGYYGAKLIAGFEFPHGIQTEPERDALGIPTIMGMTTLPNGQKVEMGMKFSEAEILHYYQQTKQKFVDAVNEVLRIPVNQYQFDALVGMAFNTGIGAFQNEPNNTVLRETNAGRFENAAAAFGKWMYGTLRGGKPGFDGKLARGPDGEPLPEGQKWKKALRGLYRRHVSEALLYSGLDWERAAHTNKIQMTKRTESAPYGFIDIVTYVTPWKLIKEDAKYDTLPPIEDPDLVIPEVGHRQATIDDIENERTAELNEIELEKLEEKALEPVYEAVPEPAPAPKRKSPQPFEQYDPAAEEKPIALSRRVWGFMVWVYGAISTFFLMIAEMPFVGQLAAMSPVGVDNWRLAVLILGAGLLLSWYGQVKAKGPLR